VLVAAPALSDPNFYRTVVLICEHSESGSFGLILNRESEIEPAQLVEPLAHVSRNLRLGGPVQPDTLHYLHDFGPDVPDALQVGDGVWWGGDFDAIQQMINVPERADRLSLFLGYAGWGSGQLEGEIEEGGWFISTLDPGWVFTEDPDQTWRQALLGMGGEYALWANFPEEPRLN
jgi:putative transcriptional regulator